MATAKERLIANAEWARGFSDIDGSWNGNTYTFAVSIQGISIRGSIEVGETSLSLDGQLPWIAMPFAGWMPRMIRTAVEPRSTAAATVLRRETEGASSAAQLAATAPTVLYLADSPYYRHGVAPQCSRGRRLPQSTPRQPVAHGTTDGSSSMASVCGGAMSMMDAGVPLKAAEVGVAMDLVMDEKTGRHRNSTR